MTAAIRRYRLTPGVQELLALGVASIPDKVKAIEAEVDSGVITESTRSMFYAFGWITERDARLTLVPEVTPTRAGRDGTLRERKAELEALVPRLDDALATADS